MNKQIKNLRIGEILQIEDKEYIIANTPHKNGSIEWEQATLIQLKKFIKGTPKKLRGCEKKSKLKKWKGIKLKVVGNE